MLIHHTNKCPYRDSNPGQPASEAGSLPTSLQRSSIETELLKEQVTFDFAALFGFSVIHRRRHARGIFQVKYKSQSKGNSILCQCHEHFEKLDMEKLFIISCISIFVEYHHWSRLDMDKECISDIFYLFNESEPNN
jgi:hypothetical protein